MVTLMLMDSEGARLVAKWDVNEKGRRYSYYNIIGILLLWLILLTITPCYALEVDLSIISQIESSNNPRAIGDNGRAIGLYQLHLEPILDFNTAQKAQISHQDAFNQEIAHMVAYWYLNTKIPQYIAYYAKKGYPVKDTLENRLTAYNMGIGALIKGKRANRYIEKYRRLYGKKTGI